MQSRLSTITKAKKVLQPTSQVNIAKYNDRLIQLKDFESRSDSLVEVLEQQLEGTVGEVRGKTNSQKNPQITKDAIEKYREEITRVLKKFLQ